MPGNDWYEPHKTEVANALKKGKAAPKDKAIACTLVRMKDGSHLLCAAVAASKSASMVKEARNAGGKVVSAGRLFLDGSQVTFEVSEGALPAKAKFTEAAVAAGVPLGNAVLTPAPGAALAAEPGAAPAPPGAPPADGAAALKEALTRLVPTVQKAVKDHPERKNEMLQSVARCKQEIETGQAAAAKASLVQLVGFLKQLGPSAVPPAPPVPPPSPPAQSAPPAAPPVPPAPTDMPAFMARARALKAAVDQTQASDPGRAADLAKLLAKAAVSAKAKDLAGATAALDAVEAGLKKQSEPSAPPPPESEPDERSASEQESDEERGTSPESQAPPTMEPQTGANHWDAERKIAVAKLQDEIKLVAAANDPDAGKAELELRAVLKQLTGKMETQQQATEMERYLHDDDVVAEVCELAFDLKTPLLKVLKEIKPQLLA